MSRKVLYSKQRAHVAVDGAPRYLELGEAYDADDPVVQLYPSMFTDDPTPFMRGPVSTGAIETMSADPGERRARKTSTSRH